MVFKWFTFKARQCLIRLAMRLVLKPGWPDWYWGKIGRVFKSQTARLQLAKGEKNCPERTGQHGGT